MCTVRQALAKIRPVQILEHVCQGIRLLCINMVLAKELIRMKGQLIAM